MNCLKIIQSRRGLSLGTLSLMLVVFAGMVAVSIPGVAREHRENAANICVENLVRIENAKIQYALDHKLSAGAPVELQALVAAYPARFNGLPKCPAGGTYAIGTIGTTPTCTLATQGHLIRRIISRERSRVEVEG